ncbi:MAG: hypothetical protein LBT12_02225, partial [Oscillospiraceae bacterium]|nr:hypothetical protein [Oscillospiraceae bacterium]
RRILSASPLAFGEGGVKGRIKNVLNFKKRSRVIIIAAVALAAVLSVGFAVNRATPPSEPAQELVNKPEEQPVSDSRALTAADIEEISAGTPRPRVLEQLGEPHGTLSGLFGDIYRLEDGRTAIIYYDNSGARVESTKIIAAPIPIVTLYEYSGDISSPLGASLERDGSGWVPLTGTVMVAIDVPDGTAAYRLYCAQTGTEVEPIPLRSVDYHVSDDNPNQTPDIRSPDLFKWNVSEAFPDSFLGHIWAVAADADGAETASSYVNAIYQSSGEEEKNAITQAIFDSLRYYSNGETEGLTFTVSSALDPFPVRLEARIKPWKGPQVSTDEYDALKELSRSRGPDAAPVIVQYGIPFGSPSGTANIQSATLYIEFADGAGREYPLLYDEFLRLKALAADAEGGGIQPIA